MAKTGRDSYLAAFYRGDDHVIRLSFTEEQTNGPVDFTGWSFYLTMKLNPTVPDSKADIRVDKLQVNDPEVAGGNVDIKIPATATYSLLPANYFIDIQAVSPEGVVTTLFVGRQRVLADITRRVGYA